MVFATTKKIAVYCIGVVKWVKHSNELTFKGMFSLYYVFDYNQLSD